MAWIKKNGARKKLDDGTSFPSVSNWKDDGGLRFVLQIGLHTVSLSHVERDMVIERWAKMEKEHYPDPIVEPRLNY
jgi:hypothetical protein